MRVLVYELNLFWSVRIGRALEARGHEAEVSSHGKHENADMAIVNLSETRAAWIVPELQARGIPILAHAGHKEKELLELGRQLKVTRLVTNSELTHKFDKLLAEFDKKD